jgi:hypothetical protein
MYISYSSRPFDLIILVTFGEECKLWGFSLCSFLQALAIPHLLDPDILLSTRSQTLSVYVLPLMSKFHTHTKLRSEYSFEYSNFYVFKQQKGRKMVPKRMAAIIARI